MTKVEKDFLVAKKQEVCRLYSMFPEEAINTWDLPKFLAIITSLEREVRRLKTQAYSKL